MLFGFLALGGIIMKRKKDKNLGIGIDDGYSEDCNWGNEDISPKKKLPLIVRILDGICILLHRNNKKFMFNMLFDLSIDVVFLSLFFTFIAVGYGIVSLWFLLLPAFLLFINVYALFRYKQ
jgi:hypothetical protein